MKIQPSDIKLLEKIEKNLENLYFLECLDKNKDNDKIKAIESGKEKIKILLHSRTNNLPF